MKSNRLGKAIVEEDCREDRTARIGCCSVGDGTGARTCPRNIVQKGGEKSVKK